METEMINLIAEIEDNKKTLSSIKWGVCAALDNWYVSGPEKKMRKIAENCEKLRKIAKNWYGFSIWRKGLQIFHKKI